MKTTFILLLVVHGLIHVLGAAKAFGWADLKQIKRPVSAGAGMFWLLCALLFTASGVQLLAGVRGWWITAAVGIICSQTLVVLAWSDAKAGTFLNIVILLPVVLAFLHALPTSYASVYEREVTARLQPAATSAPLTEADVRALPAPVRKYLRFAGAMGKPKVRNFRAVFHGSMKRSLTSDWMEITAQQYDFFGNPARIFYIESSIFGVPFNGLHLYTGNSSTMRIRVASAYKVVDARGEKMFQGETVTLFNDMCFLAPATLIDTAITWETIDTLTVRATFTNRGYTIGAELTFNLAGALVNFVSRDRFLSSDGITYLRYPWATPAGSYRDFEGRQVAAYAEAVWETPEGPFPYAKYDLVAIEYNNTSFQ